MNETERMKYRGEVSTISKIVAILMKKDRSALDIQRILTRVEKTTFEKFYKKTPMINIRVKN